MTKTLKLSLVAAVAVAGFSSANAKDLSEAIKGVDVSGTIAYRYNDYEDQARGANGDASSDSATNNYKLAVNVSSKVNDDVTANTRFMVGSDNTTDAGSLGTSSAGDSNLDFELSEVNFTYTGVQGLSATVGKQGIATPWSVSRDAMGDEQTGTGAVAAYTAGPVTLVGAYFNQTNLDDADVGSAANDAFGAGTITGAEDIYVVGASASFAGVNLDAFYADLEDVFDSYTVGLSASYDVAGVNLSPFARYTSLDLDDVDAGQYSDNSLWQIGMGASMGMFNAFVAYGETDEKGGLVFIDSGAGTNMDYHWRITADGSGDAEYLYAHVDADVTDKINVGLFYSEADYAESGDFAGNDADEVYVQAKYKMSSNFTTYVRLGDLNVDNSDEDGAMGRLHVQYSF